MLVFALAVGFLLLTPGPAVLSLAGVGAAFGGAAAWRYLLGLFVGGNLVALAVVTGVAALLLAAPALRDVLLIVSVAYLAYLAFRIAFAGSRIGLMEARTPPDWHHGVLLQLINPKAYVVFAALFGGFAFDGMGLAGETLAKFAIINLVWFPIHLAWLGFGIQVRRLELSDRTQRAVNVAMALSLLAVVGLALAAPRG